MKLSIRVVTGAKKERIKKEGYGLKIWLTKKPKNQEANKALINFLAGYYDVPKSDIEIIKGEKTRDKVVEIIDL